MQVSTIGLDIAKNVFQVHGIDSEGRAVLGRKVRRDRLIKLFESVEPCLIGMEACATAHHWARRLTALGHQVRLMPPAYVKAYVKRNKNDAAESRWPANQALATFRHHVGSAPSPGPSVDPVPMHDSILVMAAAGAARPGVKKLFINGGAWCSQGSEENRPKARNPA